MALDRGTPSKVSFANLTILLDDINDERPQCARRIHRFSMLEDAPNGQLVSGRQRGIRNDQNEINL
jgi:hypothetical protein